MTSSAELIAAWVAANARTETEVTRDLPTAPLTLVPALPDDA